MAKRKNAGRPKKTDQVPRIKVQPALELKWAKWLKQFATEEGVEIGIIVERALELLKKETGFHTSRRTDDSQPGGDRAARR